ncbi:hypothetical protein CEW92_17260 [Bacillaceae bacterium SAS-127]|nr:hypothetical protein CEW92_17260 [Bacillaceae bacterium SAS-127]
MNKTDFLRNIQTRLGRSTNAQVASYQKGIPERNAVLSYSQEELIEEYTKNLEAVHGEVFVANDTKDVQQALQTIIERHQAQSIIRWDDEELTQLPIDQTAIAAKTTIDIWDKEATKESNIAIAKQADIGITTADFAIANTGTAVLIYNEKKGRGVSLLPPVHIIIFKQEQLVARMGNLFTKIREKDFSTLHFLTGPSKSGDIELQMTTGVHGPKHVYAIVRTD